MKKKKISNKERFTSFIAYIFGPAPIFSQTVSIIILITKKKSKYIRFHALQSLIFFTFIQLCVILLSYTLIGLIIIPFIFIAEFILWLLFLFRSFNGEEFTIPIVGSFVKKEFLAKN